MKKNILIILMLLSLASLVACSTKNSTEIIEKELVEINNTIETDSEIVDLRKEVFADIYQLSVDDEIDNINVVSSRTIDLKDTQVEFDKFKNIYESLLEVNCINSSKNEVATIENVIDYDISFRLKDGEDYALYHINFGDSYLLVSLIGVNDYTYKHELIEEDYVKLKKMLDILN